MKSNSMANTQCVYKCWQVFCRNAPSKSWQERARITGLAEPQWFHWGISWQIHLEERKQFSSFKLTCFRNIKEWQTVVWVIYCHFFLLNSAWFSLAQVEAFRVFLDIAFTRWWAVCSGSKLRTWVSSFSHSLDSQISLVWYRRLENANPSQLEQGVNECGMLKC